MIKLVMVAGLLLFIQTEAQATPRTITSTIGTVLGDQGTRGSEVRLRPDRMFSPMPPADQASAAPSAEVALPRRRPRPMTEGEMQGLGCFASAVTATGITYATSPSELALVTGGTVVPTTPEVILALAVTGTISLAACGMGAILAPWAAYAYEEAEPITLYFQDNFSSALARFLPGNCLQSPAPAFPPGRGLGIRPRGCRPGSVRLVAQHFGLLRQLTRRAQHLGRGGTGLRGCLHDLTDVLRDLVGAGRGLGDVAGDLGRGGALLLDRGGDRRGDLVHLPDGAADAPDRRDRAVGLVLDRGDLGGDLLGRLGGLVGEVLDLAGDHGEALAGLAGAGRLDRGVERQQVGLAGDVVDQLDHVADLLRRLDEALDRGVVGPLGLADRLAGDAGWSVLTWRPISAMEPVSSSAAAATVWTLAEACSAAPADGGRPAGWSPRRSPPCSGRCCPISVAADETVRRIDAI